MTMTQQLIETAKAVHLSNYKPAPVVLTSGQGCRVRDVEGKSYLDLGGGIAVLSVGHAHPHLVDAIHTQAAQLMHVSNIYYNDRAIELAQKLVEKTAFDRVYFSNSGAEANEAMLKLARRYHYEQTDGDTARTNLRTDIVSTWNSFHGRTLGALSVTGQPKYQRGMGPLLGGVSFVDFNNIDAMRDAVGPTTAAVILEPIQIEGGGIVAADSAYLVAVREICDAAGALLLFDEVQTGYGRTGRFLCQEWSGVVPDACSLAKGIAGGFPLGAMLVTEKVAAGLPPGSHASTYGGNPLACAAGLAVLEIFDKEDLLRNSTHVGNHLGQRCDALAKSPHVIEARGIGLLRGVQLSKQVDAMSVLNQAREQGVLITIAAGDVLRFCPALNITIDEINEGLNVVEAILANPPMHQNTSNTSNITEKTS